MRRDEAFRLNRDWTNISRVIFKRERANLDSITVFKRMFAADPFAIDERAINAVEVLDPIAIAASGKTGVPSRNRRVIKLDAAGTGHPSDKKLFFTAQGNFFGRLRV